MFHCMRLAAVFLPGFRGDFPAGGSMKKTTASPPIEYVPRVLKLDKRKFACFVEQFIGNVRPLDMTPGDVRIVSRRKKAWRAALAMARLCSGKSKQRSQRSQRSQR